MKSASGRHVAPRLDCSMPPDQDFAAERRLTAGATARFAFKQPAGSTEVLLVRHGESEPADPDRPFPMVDGRGDPALSPLGRQQARTRG